MVSGGCRGSTGRRPPSAQKEQKGQPTMNNQVKHKKQKLEAELLSQEELAPGIFSMWLQADEVAKAAGAGQFLSVYTRDSSRLLPRPISICEIDEKGGKVRLVYRVAGAGTREFSGYRPGDPVTILGPLGNGFPLESRKKAFLIGGGIGIPPMIQLARSLDCERQMILGYRDTLFLDEEFAPYGPVYLATEDGSAGTRGNVLDAIGENHLEAEIIYACGPTPMLRAIKEYAGKHGMECYLSLEERMACGIGACLACVCGSTEVDAHSHVHNKRICKDGPVFRAEEVEL